MLRHVWLLSNERLDGWGDDAGIDLVAENHNGLLWAIRSNSRMRPSSTCPVTGVHFFADCLRKVNRNLVGTRADSVGYLSNLLPHSGTVHAGEVRIGWHPCHCVQRTKSGVIIVVQTMTR